MRNKILLPFLALFFTSLAPANAATEPSSAFFFPSIISVQTSNHTVTLPLYHGEANGKSVWYIITDSSDPRVAKEKGVAYSPNIATLGNTAIVNAGLNGGVVTFAGAPSFTTPRSYVASTSGFPPKSATPGGLADAAYSPFVRIDGTPGVLNAPIVAVGDGPFDVDTHRNTSDRVVAIDTQKKTVTMVLARGFFNNKPIYYLSTDASDPVAASVERATYDPRLAKAASSGTIPIGVVVSGPQHGADVQGLDYLALQTPLGKVATPANAAQIGSPFNVLSLVPNTSKPYAQNAYSPLWAVVIVGQPQTKRLTSFSEVAPISKPAGFVVDCPAIALDESGGY